MSYLVLARKYRPQTFEELVGQEHVTRTLVNALESKRVGHAYIFSGPRGCGKTTTARLLAKALNCEKGPTAHPCNECAACKEISEGSSADDVMEIDGASNRGIDQIRELRDTVKYAPARCRYRIVIIDEAHQITDAGFNALLKTLEEPPPHAVFMMATTEAQKIPPTILSRCQRFQLKSIAPADTVRQLKKILAAEKIKAEDEALFEVARAAHGGLRDALSLLDQVISFSPEGVTARSIRDLLGLLPREKVREFAAVLRDGSPEKTLQAVQKASDEGFELGQLARDLLDYFHELLLWKNGVRGPETVDPAAAEKEAALYEEEDLERALQILARAAERLRRSESPRATFELACLDLSRKTVPVEEMLDRLEALEARLSSGGAVPLKKKIEITPPSSEKTPDEIRSDSNDQETVREEPVEARISVGATGSPFDELRGSGIIETASINSKPPPSSQPPTPSADMISPAAQSLQAGWPRVLEAVGMKKPSLEPFLALARPEFSAEGSLRILCRDDFQRSQISAQLALLTGLVQKEIGPYPVSCAVAAAPPRPTTARPATETSPFAPANPPRTAGSPEGRMPPPPVEDAEEASDDEAPPDEEEDSPVPKVPAAVLEENQAASTASAEDAGEIASLEPGIKLILDRFPGKLKKLDPVP